MQLHYSSELGYYDVREPRKILPWQSWRSNRQSETGEIWARKNSFLSGDEITSTCKMFRGFQCRSLVTTPPLSAMTL